MLLLDAANEEIIKKRTRTDRTAE